MISMYCLNLESYYSFKMRISLILVILISLMLAPGFSSCDKKKIEKAKVKNVNMNQAGYFISVSVPQSEQEVGLAIYKILSPCHVLMGFGSDKIAMTNLYVSTATHSSASELKNELKALKGVSQVLVSPLSSPIKPDELAEVRSAFAAIDRDATSVSDELLSMYLNLKLQGKYTHYMDFGFKPNSKGLFPMRINRLEDHPEFSPEWLKDTAVNMSEGKEEYFVSGSMTITSEEKRIVPPPPPPLRPNNLDKMSDEQVRQWIKKHDHRKLKDKDIHVSRTSEEVLIEIEVDGGTERLTYKL